MKLIVNLSRVIVGFLFIFSGLVKANDPHGLSYKMQEFFERWAADGFLPGLMNFFHSFSLSFSIIMITLEIIIGVGILLGTWKKLFAWIAFLLIVFFTFLTGYAALSGKIATCGCFGDCLPLTSMQSFVKDLVLLVLTLIILLGTRFIKPLFTMALDVLILAVSLILVLGFQWYVMHYLPVVDCLPFKAGNNLLELRKMPADAVPDKKEYRFIYEKGGREKEFSVKDLPDSTWQFVSRKDVIIEKGKNNEPPIKDYYLFSLAGNDSTEMMLSLDADYYMFYVKDIKETNKEWLDRFKKLYALHNETHKPLLIVTIEPERADQFFNVENLFNLPVFSLDATAFKTAARTNPELYLMHGPVVRKKWGSASFQNALK